MKWRCIPYPEEPNEALMVTERQESGSENEPSSLSRLCIQLDDKNKDLKQRNEALEDVDDVSSSYMKLAKKAIEALSGYSFRDDFQKEFNELQKEFEEIKNA